MTNRIDKLLTALAPLGAGAMVLHSPKNMRYFSGFTGEGCVFVSGGACVVLTDSRYAEQAGRQSPGFAVMDLSPDRFATELAALAGVHGVQAMGFEDGWLPVAQHRRLVDTLSPVALVPVGDLCVGIRAVKDAGEIALLKQACAITDKAFQYALTIAKPGIREIDLSTELKYYLAKEHGVHPSFEFIVASGANGSMPHAIPSDKAIQPGDMVTLDFGAEYMGYHADMTRTFAVGEPSEKMKEIYAIVLEAQRRASEALAPGVACRAVDAVARGIISGRGYGAQFGHGLGHGVGLQIHEQPVLNARSETVLQPGMAVTVEPGIYLPGVGGVRIEDTCLVTGTGWESLFVSDKGLIIL